MYNKSTVWKRKYDIIKTKYTELEIDRLKKYLYYIHHRTQSYMI